MGFLDSLFGDGDAPQVPDTSQGFYDYANFMRNQGSRYNPWIDAGSAARDMNAAQYSRLINDPNAVQNQVAAGFQYSPYQKFMLDNMTSRMNYNAANTGMLGTTQANQSLMDDLLKMTGQFEDTYIDRGMNSYNRGLQGNEFLQQQAQQGMGAQDNLAEQEAAARLKGDTAKQQAAYENAVMNQRNSNNMWGNILGIAGGVAGDIFGGPMGGQIGSSISRSIGGGNSFSPGINGAWAPNGSGGYNPIPQSQWGELT